MPLGKKFRSSSASGRLEIKHVKSILSEPRKLDDVLSPSKVDDGEDMKDKPEWMLRELLKLNNRRNSVTLGDKDHMTRSQHQFSPESFEIEEKISLDGLKKLKLAFETFEMDSSGCISEKKFERLLTKFLDFPIMSNGQIHRLFKKIDYLDFKKISWGQFCSYMLQKNKAKEEMVKRNEHVALHLPAIINFYGHGIPNVNIHFTRDGAIVTVRDDGFVCHWSPDLQPQEAKHMFGEEPVNTRSKWVSDFTVMKEYNKLMIGTGNKEIQMYDLFSLEPYCQISFLSSIPLTLDYNYTEPDKSCVLYGDAEGCVNIILISSTQDTIRSWSRLPKFENMPSITISNAVQAPNVTFVRWKVHHDWVTQATYFPSLQAVVSSSSEESSSLVIGRVLPLTDVDQQLNEIGEIFNEGKTKKTHFSSTPLPRSPSDQTVFAIHKGVKTFDLCEKHSVLVTGGVDRLIRLWNPLFPEKPTGILTGHSAPIFSLTVASEDSRIFSVSTDATVKIWHILNQCCLFTADPKASQIHGDLSACSYSPVTKALYVAADCMAVLPLKLRPRLHNRFTVSHNEPVTCCGYSEELRQVVSCSEGAVVKVWDFDNGRLVLEFGGTKDQISITCMTFDFKERRLITGGRDGSLKIWNFNNGQCLRNLKKDGKSSEVLDCNYFEAYRNFYVLSIGAERKIDIYSDDIQDLHHVHNPQPSWKDDLMNGHKGDILCVAQCPPSLMATASSDGEIIIWNILSRRIHCRFAESLEAQHQDLEGIDTSVPCIIFLQNSKLQPFSSPKTLLSSGIRGCVNIWNVQSEGKLESNFKASKFQQKVVKLANGDKDTVLYAADRIGYIYVYNMKNFNADKKTPRAETFWRAHTGTITGLQIVDSDQVVLTSSTDHTVRLWGAQGEFIGTFGQPDIWSIHIASSWKHPGVPYEVLIDPLSMPDDATLCEKSHFFQSHQS